MWLSLPVASDRSRQRRAWTRGLEDKSTAVGGALAISLGLLRAGLARVQLTSGIHVQYLSSAMTALELVVVVCAAFLVVLETAAADNTCSFTDQIAVAHESACAAPHHPEEAILIALPPFGSPVIGTGGRNHNLSSHSRLPKPFFTLRNPTWRSTEVHRAWGCPLVSLACVLATPISPQTSSAHSHRSNSSASWPPTVGNNATTCCGMPPLGSFAASVLAQGMHVMLSFACLAAWAVLLAGSADRDTLCCLCNLLALLVLYAPAVAVAEDRLVRLATPTAHHSDFRNSSSSGTETNSTSSSSKRVLQASECVGGYVQVHAYLDSAQWGSFGEYTYCDEGRRVREYHPSPDTVEQAQADCDVDEQWCASVLMLILNDALRFTVSPTNIYVCGALVLLQQRVHPPS